MRLKRWPILAVLIGLGFVVVAVLVFASRTAAKSPGRIELSATEFDFGTIPNTEAVTRVFQVRNAGQGWLEVTGVSTSCGCTTAEVADRRLAPGEVTELTVTYDPLAHDGATGDFVRLVYIQSDDPSTPEASVMIRVTVVEP